ncbi:MAG: hypothetical protein P8Q15_02975, partial [Methylophilaceae bacterium]|nr:hypothetical protein [Methylophilaceae bacterium]
NDRHFKRNSDFCQVNLCHPLRLMLKSAVVILTLVDVAFVVFHHLSHQCRQILLACLFSGACAIAWQTRL